MNSVTSHRPHGVSEHCSRQGPLRGRSRSRARRDAEVGHLLRELDRLPPGERRAAAQRHAVIVALLPMVERLATRYSPVDVGRDELVQVGAIGLILAVDRFDYQRGVPLVAYAIPTIIGAFRHYLRDVAPMIRAPRVDERAAARDVARDAEALASIEPTAVHVNLVGEWEELESFAVPRRRSLGADADPEAVATRVMVARLIRVLPQREQLLIYLRFYEDQTLADIAARMGISESRASRLLSRALETLRRALDVEGVQQ